MKTSKSSSMKYFISFYEVIIVIVNRQHKVDKI